MVGKKKRTITKQFEHPYPSRYGSHASMISEWQRPLDEGLTICEDEKGYYVTEKNRLDSGVADPHRWAGKEYRDNVYAQTKTLVDPKRETDGQQDRENDV